MSTSDAIAIFRAGVEAVQPGHFIPQYIQVREEGFQIGHLLLDKAANYKLYLAAVGKAASAMALEAENILGEQIHEGLVVTKHGHALPLRHCHLIEAGHPVPDENSLAGANALSAMFKAATSQDVILLLISGGASALIADTPHNCSLAAVQQTVQLLLDSGAAIDEVNTVRKHLSAIKGGQLMTLTEATVIALVLSDVPGDDLSVIASGLTVADPSSFQDAWEIIEKYQLAHLLPQAIRNLIIAGTKKMIPDTPKPGNPAFLKVHNFTVASNSTALEAACQKANELGYNTFILSPMLTGEADVQAEYFVHRLQHEAGDKAVCLLWGGETTVTIKGKGKGGRNQQFALAALCALQQKNQIKDHKVVILSGGTDGTDGPTDAAGAMFDSDSMEKLKTHSLNPEAYLYGNDAYHFFEKTGGLIKTGPTQTNVMDVVVGLIR